jgi:hypothetical protein
MTMSAQEENTTVPTNTNKEKEQSDATNSKRKVSETSVDEESHVAKRPCSNDTSTEGEVLDLAKTLGYKAGDRFEVQWDIGSDESEDNDAAPDTRWWGASLLEHDGRTIDSVNIRVLNYDPYPEGGFPERSQEDVIFLGKDILANPETHEELNYRPEGEESGALWLGRGDVEEVVNATLDRALKKNSTAFANMSSAQQAAIASAVAEKKEKLLDLLLNHPNGVVTSNDMNSILSKIMQE